MSNCDLCDGSGRAVSVLVQRDQPTERTTIPCPECQKAAYQTWRDSAAAYRWYKHLYSPPGSIVEGPASNDGNR